MTTATASLGGFKDSKADLHRNSKRISMASICLSIIAFGITINVLLIQEKRLKKAKVRPVIHQLEHICEKYNANNFGVTLIIGA